MGARALPPGVRVEVGGGELAQASANNDTVVRHKLENMGQVSAVIFALSSLVFRSFAAGLLVLAPLVCAVLVNLGVMGWIGSWLSFATASYTSMGVSLGADFAIYLLFRLREEVRSRRALRGRVARDVAHLGARDLLRRVRDRRRQRDAAGLGLRALAAARRLRGADDGDELSRDADGDPGAGAHHPAALPAGKRLPRAERGG